MTKPKNDVLTFEEASKLFRYDAITGDLRWTDDVSVLSQYMKSIGVKRMRGRVAISKLDGARTQYLWIRLRGKKMYVHRVVWLLCRGEYPKDFIDHVDGNGLNNRIENLRDVPKTENARNMRRNKRNSSGHIGVGRWKNGKWFARVTSRDQERIYLGTFESMDDAIAARVKASAEHGYHAMHGK